MLRHTSALWGVPIHATGGEIGTADQVLFDVSQPFSRDDEMQLHRYYGRPTYWDQEREHGR